MHKFKKNMIPKERLVIYIRPNYCTGVAYKVFFHLSLFWWMCHYIDASLLCKDSQL